MNPFDLPGPEFLFFYFVLGCVVIVSILLIRSALESSDVSGVRLTDPYMIAYLRGGEFEALRVAAASLLDRKLLALDSSTLMTANRDAAGLVRRPIERKILERFQVAGDVGTLSSDAGLAVPANAYREDLAKFGLMPDGVLEAWRNRIAGGAVLLLLGTAATKILVALSRGRTNILYLVLMSLAFIAVANAAAKPNRTRAGNELLKDLERLFAGLKNRAALLKPGGANNELAFLAAIFGIQALPAAVFPFASRLQPQQRVSVSFDTSSSLSCSSSCGSSCGGGCGGGCGGCGS